MVAAVGGAVAYPLPTLAAATDLDQDLTIAMDVRHTAPTTAVDHLAVTIATEEDLPPVDRPLVAPLAAAPRLPEETATDHHRTAAAEALLLLLLMTVTVDMVLAAGLTVDLPTQIADTVAPRPNLQVPVADTLPLPVAVTIPWDPPPTVPR